MDASIAELIYKLVEQYGIGIVFMLCSMGGLIYIIVLMIKNNRETTAAINDLVQAFNQLHDATQEHMRQTTLIISATMSAVTGNKKAATAVLSTLTNKTDKEEGRKEGSGE